jgi:hypothetical protein
MQCKELDLYILFVIRKAEEAEMFGVILIHTGLLRRVSSMVLAVITFLHGSFVCDQAVSVHADSNVFVDASEPAGPPRDTPYTPGSSLSPAGHRIGVNARYLTMDGKPWLPVMGEFHYSRYPESEWESEILKMKAGGVQIVSTYVICVRDTGSMSICALDRGFTAKCAMEAYRIGCCVKGQRATATRSSFHMCRFSIPR